MRASLLFLLSLSPLFWTSSALEAAELRAAAARVDITPPPGLEMWGYSSRSGKAVGVLDPLHARILVLDDGTTRLSLVTLDLGRTFGPGGMEFVRARVRKSVGVEQVFFCASHTHSGPVIQDSYPGGETPRWETDALEKIASAVEKCCGDLTTARIGSGSGETYIGHNRRQVQPDGKVKMLWRNTTKVPTSPVDPRVGVIRIDGGDGDPLAILVNHACHPVVMGPDNLRYSADFPGAMARVVAESFDGNPVCFFLQGGAGDINPYFDKTPLREEGVRRMKEAGEELGRTTVRVGRSITARPVEGPCLRYSLDTLRFKNRWNLEKVLASLEERLRATAVERYRRYLSAPLDCPVMTLMIGGDIALMGMPGEPFVDFDIDFRARSPVRSSFFVGYANGYFGYFPTIQAAVVGGYGADTVVTRAQVGAGEAMVDHAVVTLYEKLGRLRSIPSR